MKQRKLKSIEEAVEYLRNYINTYDKQFGYKDYSYETFIRDILYGLGVSLSDEYRMASGFDEFKRELLSVFVGEVYFGSVRKLDDEDA